MNPYAAHLGSHDPLDVLRNTPVELSTLFIQFGSDRAERRPAPAKWSPREIICHLADCEIAHAFRLRQALADVHHTIQPFDQDSWGANYTAYDTPTALAVFSALRRWNLALIRHTPATEHSRPVTHPERGTMTFLTLIETIAGHDINHLKQLRAMAA